MTELFGRKCSLIVGDQSGNGLDLSALRVTFTVNKADSQTLAHAVIRVYNPSPDTARTVQKEFTHVFLQAGYEGNFGLIFSGAVRQVRIGRETPVDTFLEIVAQDGDEGYNFAIANTTLARGWTPDALHGAIMQAFDPYNLAAGYTPEFGGAALPRAKVCYGMARDYMRTLADSAGSSWHIADGQINMIPVAATLPGEAVVLTRDSGLVGMPQQTISGVTCRSLLNPKIRFGGQIKLDTASIQAAQFSGQSLALNFFPGLDPDGNYKVYAITMTGDTRGQAWYSDLICAGIDATAPLTGPSINATASSTGY